MNLKTKSREELISIMNDVCISDNELAEKYMSFLTTVKVVKCSIWDINQHINLDLVPNQWYGFLYIMQSLTDEKLHVVEANNMLQNRKGMRVYRNFDDALNSYKANQIMLEHFVRLDLHLVLHKIHDGPVLYG
jgi:hypothetical protein